MTKMASLFNSVNVLILIGLYLAGLVFNSSGYRIRKPAPLWLRNSTVTTNENGPRVNTTYGPVQGIYLDNGVRGFLGLRYAAPPVGPRRWKPPQKPDTWDMYHADTQPPGCPQFCTDVEPPDSCPYFYLEDCLFLNIYTPPKVTESSNLPVLMFFHGGNFLNGGSSSVLYDGRFLSVLTDTVVVASNYRLNALGFLSTEGKGGVPGLTGNYGFMDQRAAMKFINENVASFGGNPNKVTLFGQSAGAQSISLHLTSAESEPYFQQLIIESNPFTIPYQTPSSSLLLADVTTQLLHCPSGDLYCLHKKSAKDIVTAARTAGSKIYLDLFGPLHLFEAWGPIIDGKEIIANPLNSYRAGKFQRKPIMIGTLSEEARLYIWRIFPTKPSIFEAEALFGFIFGVEEALRISKFYNFTKFDDLREPMSTAATDYIFGCSTINASRLLSFGNDSQLYHYIFNHAMSFSKVWGPNYTECYGHVCHGSELPFVWRTMSLRNYTFTSEELQLADSITNYWGNFAHTGDPNNSWRKQSKQVQFPVWPVYDETSGWQGMLFQTTGNRVQSKYRDKFCQFFNHFGYTPK